MDPTRFDNLARSLAQPASRRGALGVVVGGALALLDASAGTAKRRHHHGKQTPAAGSGNSRCAQFCAKVFGDNSPATGQCTSDGAHGKGLCAKCGTAAPSTICCTRNSAGFCATYTGATCCSSTQVCTKGSCCTPAKCAAGTCGDVDNGCGGTVHCTCPNAGDVCNGGACCTPLSVCKGPGGVALCGDVPDGCGGTAQCGDCPTAGQVCKADHTCCTPAKCADGTCGDIDDGCGGTVSCTCPTGQTCQNGGCCLPKGSFCDASNVAQCCSQICVISFNGPPVNKCCGANGDCAFPSATTTGKRGTAIISTVDHPRPHRVKLH